MGEFSEVYHHRLRYFLTPQFDMYRNVRDLLSGENKPRMLVLDYGCGNGVGSVILKRNGWEVQGVDSDSEAIAFANDSWGHICYFKCENWCRPRSWWTRRYDAVVCLEVIEHVEEPQRLLENLRDATTRGGPLIVSTLNHNSQYRKNRGHIGKFTLDSFTELCQRVIPGAKIYDYTLKNRLKPGSSITPMVAMWRP